MTSDTDRARAFYGELFGWATEEPNQEFGGYFNFTKDGVRVAGGMAHAEGMPGDAPGNVWSVYLASDDAGKTVDAAQARGGQVIVPAMDVGDLGTMGVVTVPGGAPTGLWQPGLHTGFGVVGEPGAPSWFQLNTRNYDADLAFLRDVFHWETQVVSDAPEFRYAIQAIGDEQFAGVMDATAMLPADVPDHWVVYFWVDDADAALAKIGKLGGAVVRDAEDTPYGRLATAADPNGAVFNLQAPNEAMPAS
jgi:hypothetical protein